VAGGRPSIKMEIFSSVIYDIIESGPENLQQQTIESAAKDADTLKLLERIKELEGKRGGGSAGSNDPEPAYNASASSLASASATPDVIPGLPMAVPQVQAPVALPVLPQAPAPVVLPPAPVAVMPPPVVMPTLPVLPVGPPALPQINIAEPLP
jgi:hypothetical protein